ncbi:hypothetical protein D3242_21445 [Mesorhizobium jarvisii]|uniref:Uncharacterized protein n=1 Tax=Mesorhizobium jarvisii TaxID=1777867 RepID=A0AA92XDK5_9HYPH|nr:hypothetical protein D3242_21445 [Mesorhizobium jarvisii]
MQARDQIVNMSIARPQRQLLGTLEAAVNVSRSRKRRAIAHSRRLEAWAICKKEDLEAIA